METGLNKKEQLERALAWVKRHNRYPTNKTRENAADTEESRIYHWLSRLRPGNEGWKEGPKYDHRLRERLGQEWGGDWESACFPQRGHWRGRLQQVVEFRERNDGRFPRYDRQDGDERQLYKWLRRQRAPKRGKEAGSQYSIERYAELQRRLGDDWEQACFPREAQRQ